jgi:two-component system sensor histidine kinase BaeS
LEQALSNLVSNGLKFTPPGGQVRVGARPQGAAASITVTDTGMGIDPQALDSIFHRFYRADGARQMGTRGSGLGLAIAQQMIEAQNGTITVTSELGHGSVFLVTLPGAGNGGSR